MRAPLWCLHVRLLPLLRLLRLFPLLFGLVRAPHAVGTCAVMCDGPRSGLEVRQGIQTARVASYRDFLQAVLLD